MYAFVYCMCYNTYITIYVFQNVLFTKFYNIMSCILCKINFSVTILCQMVIYVMFK